ncbi:DMT family transporter [Candidatus Bealeia paramacronuclearis]
MIKNHENISFQLFFLSLIPILLWSSNYVVMRLASTQISMSVFNGLRFLFLLPLIFFLKKPSLSFLKILILAFVWIGLNIYCIGRAIESEIDTGYLALGYVTSSIFVIIFSFFINKEVLTKTQAVGAFLAFLGMGFIAYEKGFDLNYLSGVGFLLGSNFFIALGVTLLKKFNVTASLSVVTWVSGLAVIPLFGLSLIDLGLDEVKLQLAHLDQSTIYSLLYTGLGSSLLGGLVWIDVVKKMGPNASSFLMFLVPIFGLIFGHLFFEEAFTLNKMISAALVLSGVFLCLNQQMFSPKLKSAT